MVDGNYASAVQDLVWARADTVVWLDPPRRTVMRQIGWRTCRRMLSRERLWNGNRESVRNLLSRDDGLNIILWAWREHGNYRQRHRAAALDPAYADLKFIRIATRRDVRDLLDNRL